MATRDTLIKVRKVIAEFKIYISRTQTYLAPVQLFMIFIIFLNTTVWNVDQIQNFFGSKMNFIGLSSIFFIVGVLVLGYLDTKLKMFRTEQARYQHPDRNLYSRLFAFWTALLVNEADGNKKDKLERNVEPILKELCIYEEYLKCKKKK